jgi:RsiW-degrading membrane proteinase PrsW (M82 family)
VDFLGSSSAVIGSKFRDWPFTFICAAILMWMTQPWQVLQFQDALVLLASVSSVFAVLWWCDSYEREAAYSIFWAVLWGAFPACLLSYFLEGQLTTLSGGVLIEEGMKLIALLLIIRRGSIQSWTDGLVMGGYLGLGFAAMEDLVYAINGNSAFDVLITRGIFSIFAHTFFSGLGAVAIVMGYLKGKKWVSFLGFLLACFLHLTWNTVLAWELFAYNLVGFFFFFSFLPPAILILTAIFVRRVERHVLLVQGKIAIDSGGMTEEELWLVVNLKARRLAKNQLENGFAKEEYKSKIYNDARLLLSGHYQDAQIGIPETE